MGKRIIAKSKSKKSGKSIMRKKVFDHLAEVHFVHLQNLKEKKISTYNFKAQLGLQAKESLFASGRRSL